MLFVTVTIFARLTTKQNVMEKAKYLIFDRMTIPSYIFRYIFILKRFIVYIYIFLTLLGLGLIKINDVSANFNNPRPSLILSN